MNSSIVRVDQPNDQKKSKPEVRDRREPSFIRSTTARVPGEPQVWEKASLRHPRRPGSTCPPCQASVHPRPPLSTDAPSSCPPGSAPVPPLPAAAALTSERTSVRRRPTALTLFRERTNTLEGTASPPVSAARYCAGARRLRPRLVGTRRGARREGEFFRSLWLGPAFRGRLEEES